MSGHSHWATIKHKKGATDAKRGKLWSKLSRAIIVAAKNGGGDPTMNLKLRYAIDKAREVSMPNDNINRAIKRGTGETEGVTFEEITYEGYGAGGIAIMVDVLTDNRNRTSGEVRKIFERGGGNMGGPGCVAFLFERKGVVLVDATTTDEDTLMGKVLEAGAEDMKLEGPNFQITCDAASFGSVKENLEKQGVKFVSAEITKLPKTLQDADTEQGQKVMRLMEALDDHDDVQNVYSNLNVSDAMLAES
ncbi:MAG: YebC/PmpR family DNA-binding transcriptional regulator [Gemmataceae bacterium]|nr:YebC/PmpR family DNA-binding transcriptional regulator [Gemmataceae bacterium]